MFNTIEVLASGLSATRLRVNVLASNLANAQTTRTEEGGPYKRKDVVQMAQGTPSNFGSTLDRLTLARPQISQVVEDAAEPKKVFQPGHPDADQSGYVAYPNINVVTTMTDMMSASRLYQANVSAIETVRRMTQDAASISTRG